MSDKRAFTYVVDRFEDNDWVVLEREDGETFNVPRGWLSAHLKEGDVLKVKRLEDLREGVVQHFLYLLTDEEAAASRREQARLKRDELAKGPSGEIDL